MRNMLVTIKTSLIILFFSIFQSANAVVPAITPGIEWAGCGITKKAFMAELAQAYEQKTGVAINLHGGGATRGIRDTVKRKVDLGGSCRMNLPEEDRSELYAEMHPVAWDALAVITHKRNPIKSLTTEEIKQIYMGQITNWQQVGGANAEIKLYARRGTISGVGYAIRQYIFKDSLAKFKTNYIVRSSGPLEKAIEKDIYAMGITGISSARKRNVKVLGVDGKIPSFENVRDGKYGLYRPLYLVTGPAPSKQVREFISFVRSEPGRKILRDNKTVPYQDAPKLMSKLLIYGFGVK